MVGDKEGGGIRRWRPVVVVTRKTTTRGAKRDVEEA